MQELSKQGTSSSKISSRRISTSTRTGRAQSLSLATIGARVPEATTTVIVSRRIDRKIHDELDEAVFHAYGWDDLWQRLRDGEDPETVETELLERLVALNHERAEEEKRGLVRWLRPEFQAPEESGLPKEKQEEIEFQAEKAAAKPKMKVEKQKWPTALPEQVAAIQKLLPALGPDAEELSAAFGRTSQKRIGQVEEILSTLAALGQL